MSRHLGRGFLYRLAPIEELIPHEQVDPHHVKELAEDIASRGLVLRPIIVDGESGLVIDGHHRLEALRLLGARRAPIVAAARHDIHGVTTWAYLLSPRLSFLAQRIARILESSAGRGSARLTIEHRGVLASVKGDPVCLHEAVSSLVTLLGWRARRVPLHEADDKRWLVIKPPIIPHDMVVKLASTGYRLPPKTTCYLTWLKEVEAPTPLRLLL
ncbi:MAG: ParB N-terminal domain-containing protein [Crenarchaeota archaeon]|nr:ParB N-terminal domain-containing protein [Thermoproteota archaeon]